MKLLLFSFHFSLISWAFFASKLSILCAYFALITHLFRALPALGVGKRAGRGAHYLLCVFGFFLDIAYRYRAIGYKIQIYI